MDVSEEELQPLYDYVDGLPLSRPKRNIARDFADGLLVAEIVHHEAPRAVEMHNYSPANSAPHKLYNWTTLNQRVFKRHLGFVLARSELEAVSSSEVGAIERILKLLRIKLKAYKERQAQERQLAALDAQGQAAEADKNTGHSSSQEHAQEQQSPAPAHAVTATVTLAKAGTQKAEKSKSSASADLVIKELRDTNDLLMLRADKLEQLLRLRDSKITTLTAQLKAAGLA